MKAIPRVVQLPGGIRLVGVPFRVTEYASDGTPLTFQILPPGTEAVGRGVWVLYASEDHLRAPVDEANR